MLVDQPPCRRSRASFSSRRGDIPNGCRISYRQRQGDGFRRPKQHPADLVVAGNDPWPGDPMQSFKVLLHHRAATRPGGVLAGLFWTDPDEIDRSFPINALRLIAATGRWGGWTIRRLLPLAARIAGAAGSPAAFMLHWACELVVDRTVLVYAPPLYDRIGPRLGPVQLYSRSELRSGRRPRSAATRRDRTVQGVASPCAFACFRRGG